MCIRDRGEAGVEIPMMLNRNGRTLNMRVKSADRARLLKGCLLYTSDAADERSSVDLGGRRIIKKKTREQRCGHSTIQNTSMKECAQQKTKTEKI